MNHPYIPWSPDGKNMGLVYCAEEWTKLGGFCSNCGGKLVTEGHECNYFAETGEEWCTEYIKCPTCNGTYTGWDGWIYWDNPEWDNEEEN